LVPFRNTESGTTLLPLRLVKKPTPEYPGEKTGGKMQNFTFENATRILFGKGTQSQVGAQTALYAKKVLLHYGSGSIKRTGLYDQVMESLREANVQVVELGGVVPNPRLSLVHEGIEICRKEGISFLLAVGGGSVIDSAKAIAAGVPYQGDVWDFYEGKAELKDALGLGVVLTIPAAGSETSAGTVLSREEDKRKRSFGGLLLRPKFAIMNPELTFTLPPYQTAAGITDMLAHVFERYFTQTDHTDLTDRLCEATMKTIIRNAPKVLQNPRDYDARAEIMWAGTLAHNDLLDTGRQSDWATHGMEHEISALYDIAHGAGLAILFPAWMRYVYPENRERFLQFAQRVWDVEPDFFDPDATILEGIARYKAFLQSIGMPVSFADAGLPGDRLEEMAKKFTEYKSTGNFKKLDWQDALAIYRSALR